MKASVTASYLRLFFKTVDFSLDQSTRVYSMIVASRLRLARDIDKRFVFAARAAVPLKTSRRCPKENSWRRKETTRRGMPGSCCLVVEA